MENSRINNKRRHIGLKWDGKIVDYAHKIINYSL